MLHPNKLKKKAIEGGPLTTVIIFVILIVFAALMIFGPVKKSGTSASQITAMGPSTDELCIARSKMITGERVDIDADGRDDYLCDSCVCQNCNNDKNDMDKDKLPDCCDAKPADRSDYSFNTAKCPEKDLIDLGGIWKKQCRPTICP